MILRYILCYPEAKVFQEILEKYGKIRQFLMTLTQNVSPVVVFEVIICILEKRFSTLLATSFFS